MKNKLSIFEHEEFGTLKVLEEQGEFWFVGIDVATALGYANARKAIIDHVDNEDKNTVTIRDGIRGNPNKTVINESGLYSLILSSKLPGAKKFKRWVTSEILPTIRKQGVYFAPTDYVEALEALVKSEKSRLLLLKENKELKPKASFAEQVQLSPGTISMEAMAKLLNKNGVDIGRNRLFEELRKLGYICKQIGSEHNPLQWTVNAGLFELEERMSNSRPPKAYTVTTVTPAGQKHLLDLFLNGESA